MFKSSMMAGLTAALTFFSIATHAADVVLTSEVAATHWKTSYMNDFANEVNKRTNGAVNVKVFPSGQLYKDQAAVAALGTGSVHMVWPVSVRLETVDAGVGIINLPFAVTDSQMVNQCFNRDLVKMVSAQVEPRNLKVLGFLRASDLLFLFKDRDVKKMEDMKGAKIRVTGGKVFLDTIRSLKASPVSMAASEMSTALAQGAIDGVFTSPGGWSTMIGMTAKYAWYVPGLSLATYAVVVDKAWYDGLSAGHRKVVDDVTTEMGQRQWNEAIELDKKAVDEMVAKGAVYRVADQAERERWVSIATAGNKTFTDKHPEVTTKLAQLTARCGAK